MNLNFQKMKKMFYFFIQENVIIKYYIQLIIQLILFNKMLKYMNNLKKYIIFY